VTVSIPAPAGYEQFQTLETCRYGNFGIFRVMRKPLDEVAGVIKWSEDKVIAAVCMGALLPPMAVIAIAIKLESTGPVLFKQLRLGAGNVQFYMFKFRTMYADQADPLGQELTRAEDPRVTRVGRFLRRMSLDELPQLFNVLRGEMSLVGPRPHALAAKADGIAYALAVDNYPIRHRMKPGITGWAQVNGYRGETRTIEQIRRRVEYDLYYIQNWSLWFDLVILARTVLAVFSRTNAV
jgi:exopolysaccharide biosynthesis polyprenyl glycosylphosphotransferase